MLEVTRFGPVTQFKMATLMEGFTPYWVAAYLVDGLLVDTGCAHTAAEFMKALEAEVRGGQRVEQVVNTHHHEDHVGANRLVQERFGARIFAHPASVPLIARRPELQFYREAVWGCPEPSNVLPLGGSVRTAHLLFEVVETPGHSDGHVALVEKEKGWCFSGDLYVGPRVRAIRPDEDVAEVIRSLERLSGAASRLTLYTGTGRVVEDGRRALVECSVYLRELWRRAHDLHRQGRSVPAIRDELLGRESVLAGLTDGHFSADNLVRGLLAAKL